MADEYILKSYDGGAETTTLTSPFTVSGTTLVVANGSTFPDGSSGPFVVVVDRGLASEEKFLIDTTTGVNGTTFNIQQAAYDGTSASAHSVGATVEHCLDAFSIEQANRYVNLQTARGDLISHNNTTSTKLVVGANNTVLMADSAQSVGLKYSLVGENSIADNSITSAKLNSALIEALQMPSGVVAPFAGSTSVVPTGWLLCDGSAVNRTTYSALFNVISTTYGSGDGSNTFNLPDLRTRIPVGFSASDTDTDPTATNNALNSLGKTGGSKIHTLATSEMPGHTHSGPSHTHAGGSHTHFYPHIHIVASRYVNGGTPAGSGNTFLLSAGGSQALTGTTDQDPEVTNPPGAYNTGLGGTGQTGLVGDGAAHNNLQPYIVMNYIIKS